MEHMETTAPIQERPGGKRVAARAPKKKKTPLLAAGVILAVLAAAYLGLCVRAVHSKTIWKNTLVLGQDLGGLTVEQAAQKLDGALPGLEVKICLYDGSQAAPEEEEQAADPDMSVSLADLGLKADTQALARDAFALHTEHAPFLTAGWRYLFGGGVHYSGSEDNPSLDAAAVSAFAASAAEKLSQAAVDTSFALDAGDSAVAVTVGTDGRTVDAAVLEEKLNNLSWTSGDLSVELPYTVVSARTLTAQEIHDEVAAEMKNAGYDAATKSIIPEQVGAEFDVVSAQTLLDAAAPGDTVSIPATIEQPAVTAEKLKGVLFRDVLGTATTHVSGTGPRVENVKLASSAVNGTVLNSGDVFSYNKTTGERTAARGYGSASAYINGLTVDTVGGGVCQPSSTLYLACLNSNLQIVERYAHRFTPSYIAKGMDATVSWGSLDYKFRNNTDYPIKIKATYSKGTLTMTIYGTKTSDVTVKMTNKVLSSTPWKTVYEEDDTLPAGTEEVTVTPYTGYKVQTFRNLYDGKGNLISSTFEANSDYKVRDKVITKGPAKSTPASGNGGSTSENPSGSSSAGTGSTGSSGTGTVPEPDMPVPVEPEPADPGQETGN